MPLGRFFTDSAGRRHALRLFSDFFKTLMETDFLAVLDLPP
jgi:hypothetical protein